MTANENLLARRAAVVPRGVPRVTTATVARGRGAVLTDAERDQLVLGEGG